MFVFCLKLKISIDNRLRGDIIHVRSSMAPPGKRFINVEVPEDHYLILKRLAASEGQRSVASLVRMAVAEFIGRGRQQPVGPTLMPPPAAAMSNWVPTNPEAREMPNPDDEAKPKPGDE
jgi:hypothetical protein